MKLGSCYGINGEHTRRYFKYSEMLFSCNKNHHNRITNEYVGLAQLYVNQKNRRVKHGTSHSDVEDISRRWQ